MNRESFSFIIVVAFLFSPIVSSASGKHEGLNCTGCHGAHNAKGNIIFAVEPNKKAVNPATKKPYDGTTALCLSCHETTENGGMGILPVSGSMSHPYGRAANPKVANVPPVFLRNDKLECVGCHDPHPSNPNYKYLRVDTKAGADMKNFCSLCHSTKSGTGPKELRIFNSMDERVANATQPAAQASVPVSGKNK